MKIKKGIIIAIIFNISYFHFSGVGYCAEKEKRIAKSDNLTIGELFLGLSIGGAIPMADDDYTDRVGVSFKFPFLSAGFVFHLGPVLVGPEFVVDFTPFNIKEDYEESNLHLYRMRIQPGGRIIFPVPNYERLRLLWRVDIGADITWGEWDRRGFNDEDDSAGIAMEFAGGFEIKVHRMVGIGAYMALPVSIHEENLLNLDDYNSLDLDFMTFVTVYPLKIMKK